ncbi:amidophosphoribosyltransferase [Metallosphaera sedula]|uniref:Amidophosphoribosyltransferase n=3 Tax=Metallosphaera TaxID=41980 RepID=A4YI69_METS5|nr:MULTISPECIES: amidophosphoribosyltransferase [Metallosphaera]ABP96121.1 amidophosphoribosyltransferase [Metallosphaera sedula DSM 5348]AIM28104.1 amidophosphoribosyltransferase [Metallosphaera sedula]AKV74930.1 amidophosphoribosyltransferase [Metallosphaera sedula]AKV77168.1 amidophosphoribosyltransferase [Metallosphaera sedula]AKV79418.1 amidophosphoribosyltransferase [Metallosphaera sedula]
MNAREHCGVFGVVGPDSTKLTFEGLKLLQHRGQESAGISWIDGDRIQTRKGLGLVGEALDPKEIGESLFSIGHVRYSTTGSTTLQEAQPLDDGFIAVSFNGTITNHFQNGDFSTDTEFILSFLRNQLSQGRSLESSARAFMDVADGAFSLLVLSSKGEILAMRDPRGFRPLVIGEIGDNKVVSSEDSAIKQLGGRVIGFVHPGEIIKITRDTVVRERVSSLPTTTCAFEYIYFSRADSEIDGISVYASRIKLGELLARNHPANGDVVVPVPDSSRPIALGFSRTSGIPLEEALVRTISSKRSFIMPSDEKRNEVLKEKFGIVEWAVRGKRVVLVDDSIVRGNTMKRIVNSLRSAGAREVHIRIGSPMIRFPCYMGIDFPRRSELVANIGDERAIARELNADSVEYLSVEEMVQAIGRTTLCKACFTGEYPLKGKYDLSALESVFAR